MFEQQDVMAIVPVEPEGWSVVEFPLGAERRGGRTTFAVYAANATRVLLEFYRRPTGEDAFHEVVMAKNPQGVWQAALGNVPPAAIYGFRVWGPNWDFDEGWQRGGSAAGFKEDVDTAGNRYNPNKVLFDPYARELTHDRPVAALAEVGLTPSIYATGEVLEREQPRREIDTGRWATKGYVLDANEPVRLQRPLSPPENAVIYEAHLRGLTRHASAAKLKDLLRGYPGFEAVESVPEHEQGTYAGAARMASYLKALGVSVIEFMPLHEFEDDENPLDRPGGNFWGYMTTGFFAPNRRYACDKSPGGPTREFRAMLEAFHAQGIEVYLDVVYNHSGEGGHWEGRRDSVGFSSLGGFDVQAYYEVDERQCLVDGATGTGNQLDFSGEVPRRLVLDSLQYWIDQGVDGFRFDLAPVLGRMPDLAKDERRFFSDHPLLVAIRDLGKAHGVEMVAEAWDLWGYEVGNFPAEWGEWNGRYRDAVRAFFKGDGKLGTFMDMVNGDYAHFNDSGGPQHTINFICAHDGFTMADLVSYNDKLNSSLSWPFGPAEGGTDSNRSWDSGGNGALRRQRFRNFWTALMFSRGVPMFVYGDEFARTQNGNNNPYAIDSVATWNNYEMLATNAPHRVSTGGPSGYHDNFGSCAGPAMHNGLFWFVAQLIRLRRSSRALKQRQYGDLSLHTGHDVTYAFTPHPEAHGRAVQLQIDASAVGEQDFLLFFNMDADQRWFGFPAGRWQRVIDTAAWAEPEGNLWERGQGAVLEGVGYSVAAWSSAVFVQCQD